MTSSAEIQSAVDRLRASAAPIAQTIAETNAATDKLARVQQLGRDAKAAASDLAPYQKDLAARTARNVALRARLAELKKAKGVT